MLLIENNKDLRKSAREVLKSKWIPAIYVSIISFIFLNLLSEINLMIPTSSILNTYNTKFLIKINLSILSVISLFVNIFFEYPVLYGVVEFFLNIVRKDLFSYFDIFKGFKHYKKCFLFGIFIKIIGLFWSAIVYFPMILLNYLGFSSAVIFDPGSFSFNANIGASNVVNMVISMILTIALNFLLIIILSRYMFAIYILRDNINSNMTIFECIKISKRLMRGKYLKYIRLQISFLIRTGILIYIISAIITIITHRLQISVGTIAAAIIIMPYFRASFSIFYDESLKEYFLNEK